MARILQVAFILLAICCCQNNARPQMTIEQAKVKIQKAMPNLTVFEEGLSPNALDYYIDDIADIDADGSYEVALGQRVEGSMGFMGGDVFRLEGDSLVYIQASHKLGRSRGSIKYNNGNVILTSPVWGVSDPNCCPRFRAIEVFRYSRSKGFWSISADTVREEQR